MYTACIIKNCHMWLGRHVFSQAASDGPAFMQSQPRDVITSMTFRLVQECLTV